MLTVCQKSSEKIAISKDGVPIHYDVFGKGKPTLIFVHGWSCDRSYWDAQVDHFSKMYRIVTIDLGGHGDSGLNRQDWTIEAFGKDVQAVVEKLNLNQVILLGHSMGGPVIAEATKHIPEKVIALVGVDTYHNIEERPKVDEINQFLTPLRNDFVKGTKTFVNQFLFSPKTDSALAKKITNDMTSGPAEVGLSALENSWQYDLTKTIDYIKVPIYSICSDMYPVNIEACKKYADTFSVKFMSNVGHYVMMEDPDTFNRLLEETLQEITSRL